MIMKSVSRGILMALLYSSTMAVADWSGEKINLPNLSSSFPHFGATAFDQFNDGRLVYGNNAHLYVQDALGSSSLTEITNCPAVDPSVVLAVTCDDGEYLALGAGGFGASAFYFTTTPYTSGSQALFSATDTKIQNYSAAVFGDRAYIAGTMDSGKHGVAAANLSTKVPQLIVGDVSTYSAGIAVDKGGNLYVADNDDSKIYRFSKTQLDNAFSANTVLPLSEGTFVCQLSVCGTISVDEYGCLWATGWQQQGIEVYNPALDRIFSYVPSLENANYKVSAFTANGTPYISYITHAGWFPGDAVEYGWDFASRYARDNNRNFHTGYTSACDVAVYHLDSGSWMIQHPDATTETISWGWSDAYAVPADYDGDGKTDLAVYSFDDGQWIIRPSSSPATVRTEACGWNEALPVQGDYDGDGCADVAVFHPTSGSWIIQSSMTGVQQVQNFGWAETWPVAADYDGDGRTDIAVYYNAAGTWLIQQSSTDTLDTYSWGWNGAMPVPGDYDGDGITDIAVFSRNDGAWIIRQSSDPATPLTVNWGWSGAWPVPADYDGDGILDMAVYSINDGAWIIRKSTSPSTPEVIYWGFNEVFPVSSVAGINIIY